GQCDGVRHAASAHGGLERVASGERRREQPGSKPPASEQAGFQPGLVRHHVLVPGRIEHQLDVGLGNGRHRLDLGAHVVHQDVAHAAAGRGQCHADGNGALALGVAAEHAVVDQAQIDDVDRDLRIEAGAQLLPHQALDILVAGVLRQLQRRRRFLADGVGVLAGDAEQVAFDEDGEGTAEGLGDVSGAAGRQRDLLALRHQNGGAIALDLDGLAGAGIAHGYRLAGKAAMLASPAPDPPPCPRHAPFIFAHGSCRPSRWPRACSAWRRCGWRRRSAWRRCAAGWRWWRRWTWPSCCAWRSWPPAGPGPGPPWPAPCWPSPFPPGWSPPRRSAWSWGWRPGSRPPASAPAWSGNCSATAAAPGTGPSPCSPCRWPGAWAASAPDVTARRRLSGRRPAT